MFTEDTSTERTNKWLILIVSSIVVMLEFGLVFGFSATFDSMLDKFLETRSAVATLMTLFMGVTLSFGIISGSLITKFGLPSVIFASSILVPIGFCSSFFATNIQFLYITVGIICAVGISMAHISCVVAVSTVFTGPQKELCLAILHTAESIATFVYPYFLEWLLGLYGLSGTLLILGGNSCNSFALFVLCFVNRIELNQTNDSPSAIEKRTICNTVVEGIRFTKSFINKLYVLTLMGCGLSIASVNGFIGLIPDISQWKDFTESQGLLCFVYIGVFSIFAALLPGLLNKR